MNDTLNMKTIAIVIGFIVVAAVLCGAVMHLRYNASVQAKIEVKPVSPSPQANAQFVQSVVSLPPSQRMDYIKQHPMEFDIATETPGPDMQKLLQAMKESSQR